MLHKEALKQLPPEFERPNVSTLGPHGIHVEKYPNKKPTIWRGPDILTHCKVCAHPFPQGLRQNWQYSRERTEELFSSGQLDQGKLCNDPLPTHGIC